MEQLLILICALAVVVAEQTCELPAGFKSMRECCNLPSRSNFVLQNICFNNCNTRETEMQNECAVECYTNMTNLIKDGTMNKAAAIRIYENNIFHDLAWSKLIREGVDNCNYDSSGSLEHNIVKFYNCVDDFLAENCINLKQIESCEATEEFHEKCRKFEVNCTAWPHSVNSPEDCCKSPQLVSNQMLSKCQIGCQRKEFLINRQTQCVYNCTYLETGLIDGNKVNFVVAKKMLMENTKNSESWESSIDKAVESCEKSISRKSCYF